MQTISTRAFITAVAMLVTLGSVGARAADDPAPKQLLKDDSWMSLSGKVLDINGPAFTIRSTVGDLVVEFDGGIQAPAASYLHVGNSVLITGRVDWDLFEGKKIEARSVYNIDANSLHFASGADEEGAARVVSYPYGFVTQDPRYARISGRVVSVEPALNRILLNVAGVTVRVNTQDAAGNPLRHGRIEVGARVSVFGRPTEDFIGRKEIDALSVVTVVGR